MLYIFYSILLVLLYLLLNAWCMEAAKDILDEHKVFKYRIILIFFSFLIVFYEIILDDISMMKSEIRKFLRK